MSANLLSESPVICLAAVGGVLDLRTVLEYGAYIVAIVLVTMVATLWVASGRVTLRQSDRRPDESRRRRSSRSWFGRSEDKGATGGKRRRRRSHRRRNPTLAETGGLPPIRTETSSAPIEKSEP